VPRPDNAVVALARAVSRIAEHRGAARLDGVVRGFFEQQAAASEPNLKGALQDVLAAQPGVDLDRAADRLFTINPEFGAMLRDTATPTVLRGGYKSNVIPAEAEAEVNVRLLPGKKADEFVLELNEAVDDPAIEIRYDPPTRGPVGPGHGRRIPSAARPELCPSWPPRPPTRRTAERGASSSTA
jgi:acetylornithine deacetylase/succinyl-diaminopimelate desuccinylase-like protein